MITTKFHTSYGVFEIDNGDSCIEEVEELVQKLVRGDYKWISGKSKDGTKVFFSEKILENCVFEIVVTEGK